MKENPHEGHRQRLRERYRREGLDGFEDHLALELLLSYAIPRRDVNELAHQLLDRFGGLHKVFEADPSELVALPGMGPCVADLLRLMLDLNRRYLLDLQHSNAINAPLQDTQAVGSFFLPYFYGLREETVYAAFLDDSFRVRACHELGEGGVSFAPLNIRRLLELSIAANAPNIILAHNHPNGQAIPSFEDQQTTERLDAALQAVQLRLLDHIIVAGSDFVSLEECGYLAPSRRARELAELEVRRDAIMKR